MLLVNDQKAEIAKAKITQESGCRPEYDLTTCTRAMMPSRSLADWKRETTSIRPSANRSRKLAWCWLARVVGTRIALWRPFLCDEGRAHGDLGLAKTHVAAHQTIHDLGCAHIILDGGDRGGLIRRLLEGEALAELLPFGLVQLVGVPNPGLASGVTSVAAPPPAARSRPCGAPSPTARCPAGGAGASAPAV